MCVKYNASIVFTNFMLTILKRKHFLCKIKKRDKKDDKTDLFVKISNIYVFLNVLDAAEVSK